MPRLQSLADVQLRLSGNGKTAKFDMYAYSGGRMFPEADSIPAGMPVVVNVAGIKAAKTVAVKLNHKKRAGQVDSLTMTQHVRATGRINIDRPAGQRVVAQHKRGEVWKASIGGDFDQSQVQVVKKGQSIQANGRKFAGPLAYIKRMVLDDLSFVRDPGDDATSVAIAARKRKDKVKQMPKLKSKTSKAKRKNGDKNVKAKKSNRKQKADTFTPKRVDAKAIRSEYSDEYKRIAKLEKIAGPNGANKKLLARAIDKGWEPAKLELECLRAERKTAPLKVSDKRERRITSAIAECALMANAGCDHVTPKFLKSHYGKDVVEQAESKEYRGYGIHALMHDCIRAADDYFKPGGEKTNGFIRACKQADAKLKASSGYSTLALTNVLENVAHKMMVASFNAQETVWQFIAARRSHSDFKPHALYRLDSKGSFRLVPADGEIKHISLTDTKMTNQLDTYGAMITLNRQMKINDDLGAFTQIPTVLGAQSAIRLEEALFVLILANTGTFFGAGNSNLLTGAGSALDVTSLGNARDLFVKRVDKAGKPVLDSPKILLVNSTLIDTANELFNDKEMAVTTTADKKRFKNNPHKGLYRPYWSPYLNNTAILDQDGAALTGQSDTQWYLFADPRVRACFGVAFLNNQATPTIESDETSFETLGDQWRAYHDFGVAQEQHEGGIKSDGA